MLPFRVFDRENKTTWIILNFHPDEKGGHYLAARDDDTHQDGELRLLSAQEMSSFRLLGFIEEQE